MRSGAAHECVPGIAAGLHDVVVGLVEPVGELVLAEVLPDVFGWIEFWGIGRLAGWSAFFSYGSREAAYRAADYYVGERVRGAAAWPKLPRFSSTLLIPPFPGRQQLHHTNRSLPPRILLSVARHGRHFPGL